MTASFNALKKSRSKTFDKLNKQLSDMNSKGYSNPDDDKYWKPTRDAAGNGFAIIRFLPPPAEEDMPFVRIWDHGFQGPGGWYIENSLTTLGQDDPCSQYNSKLWNSGVEADKEQARAQKRRLHYVANIYVVKDSGNPDNDGKVFLYKFGKKIFDKLNDLMNPSFEDEQPINPFDFWEGANFRLKIRKVEGFVNYDKSEFDSPAALFEDDDKMEEVWKQQHSLQEVVAPKNFKTYEELEAKLQRVLGLSGDQSSRTQTRTAEEDGDDEDDLDMSKLGKEAEAPKIKEAEADTGTSDSGAGDDDDDLAFFRDLASK